jgi:hypothetical protein
MYIKLSGKAENKRMLFFSMFRTGWRWYLNGVSSTRLSALIYLIPPDDLQYPVAVVSQVGMYVYGHVLQCMWYPDLGMKLTSMSTFLLWEHEE